LLPLGLEWVVRAVSDEQDTTLLDANLVVKEDGRITKKIIFKAGDDLRQDQLVTAFITLITGLFRSEVKCFVVCLVILVNSVVSRVLICVCVHIMC
jgi:hypothetical protein